jgi:hypothetical protein
VPASPAASAPAAAAPAGAPAAAPAVLAAAAARVPGEEAPPSPAVGDADDAAGVPKRAQLVVDDDVSDEDKTATKMFLRSAQCYYCLAVCMYGIPAAPNIIAAFAPTATTVQPPVVLLPNGKKALSTSRAKQRADTQEQLQDRRANHSFDRIIAEMRKLSKSEAIERQMAAVQSEYDQVSSTLKAAMLALPYMDGAGKAQALQKHTTAMAQLEKLNEQTAALRQQLQVALEAEEAGLEESPRGQLSVSERPVSVPGSAIGKGIAMRAQIAAQSLPGSGDAIPKAVMLEEASLPALPSVPNAPQPQASPAATIDSQPADNSEKKGRGGRPKRQRS